MRVLGAAVLAMEFFLMGFALLIAKDNHGALALALGGLLAILALLNAGLLKRKFGWIIGSILQFLIVVYGFVVPMMFFMGLLFTGLWVAAIVVGRKGEAARAALLAKPKLRE
ncbi:MAG: DUF4233 domain-containing protein [Actinobacteria bacterium]|nr:DUF4233 domain-containing protein [Actinomycetota bacterium]